MRKPSDLPHIAAAPPFSARNGGDSDDHGHVDPSFAQFDPAQTQCDPSGDHFDSSHGDVDGPPVPAGGDADTGPEDSLPMPPDDGIDGDGGDGEDGGADGSLADSYEAVTSTGASRPLTPGQRRVFDDLLRVGVDRPVMPVDLPERLVSHLESGTEAALARWTENRMWVSKSQITTVLRCEGMSVAYAGDRVESDTVNPTVIVGLVAHRAIQITHTHPDLPVQSAVAAALEATLGDERLRQWWGVQSIGLQSDLICQMNSRAVGFLDAFPPLSGGWLPRFEEPVQAKVGRLTLSARPDLILGRPKADNRQTMFLCDFKTGSLGDHHFDEAMFYALVATLRYQSAPYRSTVFSLASGDWSEADVDAERLFAAADQVVDAVCRIVEVLTESRPAVLTPDRWCSWCPAAAACPSSLALRPTSSAPQRPVEPSAPVVLRKVTPRTPSAARSAASVAAAAEPSIFDID
jgi:hypothetical protein